MVHYLIPAGLVLNSLLITFNRFVRPIPDWLYIPGMLCGIVMIIAGAFFQKI